MVYESDDLIVLYKKDNKGIEILRVYSRSPYVLIPGSIDGCLVYKIGDYCFSETPHIPPGYKVEILDAQKLVYHEAAGNFVEQIELPYTVESIGRNAFYNCRKLKNIVVGKNCEEIGGDIFMNCRSLDTLKIHGEVEKKSGVKQILSRYSSDIEVIYENDGVVSAKIFYPEYTESYDEIAPAHIFGRNITGEGFRARECFADGVPDMVQYDKIFEKASAEESVKTASRMAIDRLYYPVDLADSAKNQYIKYIKNHEKDIIRNLVLSRKLELIYFICSNKFITAAAYDIGIAIASENEWGEGAASILKWKHEFCGSIKKKRYAF